MYEQWPDDPDHALDQQVEQLMQDSRFRAWVLNPTPDSEAYWTDFLTLHPTQKEAVQQARMGVMALQMRDYPLTDEAINAHTQRLLQRIRATTDADEALEQNTGGRVVWFGARTWQWVAAASVVLMLGWWGYQSVLTRQPGNTAPEMATSLVVPGEVASTMTEAVADKTERRVTLPDGSVVTLSAQSRLRYSQSFQGNTRTVALVGQAFFDVKRDPKKPFLVFTNDVVTRVLGTSFTVRSRPGQAATVVVRTGRVAVYARKTYDTPGRQALTGLSLTPNQQATLSNADGTLKRSVISEPQPLPTQSVAALDFDDRPVEEVIDALEKTYGVPIQYDRQRVGNCRVTVSFVNEPLFDQLALLAKLLDGRYVVQDGVINLYVDGCQ